MLTMGLIIEIYSKIYNYIYFSQLHHIVRVKEIIPAASGKNKIAGESGEKVGNISPRQVGKYSFRIKENVRKIGEPTTAIVLNKIQGISLNKLIFQSQPIWADFSSEMKYLFYSQFDTLIKPRNYINVIDL